MQIRTNSEVVRWWWCSGDSGMRNLFLIFGNLKSILSLLVRCKTPYGKRVCMGNIVDQSRIDTPESVISGVF